MILPESFSRQWITDQRKKVSKSDPGIIEKLIHALALVEQLKLCGLDFVFKGGTSLILLLNKPRRFSIDVDIVTEESREKIEGVLDKVCSNYHFIRFELDEDRSYKGDIPKAHYELFFHSEYDGKEKSILLDILFEKHPYPTIIHQQVAGEWIKTDQTPIEIAIPDINSIAGDKLTAFAPNTTGVPYFKRKELEIVKQLFDLGRLYDNITDLSIVSSSFKMTVEKEIGYRSEKVADLDEVLMDIIKTSELIAKRGTEVSETETKKFLEIQNGIKQLKGFLMGDTFRIEEAILYSAKVSLLAAKIKTENFDELPHWESSLNRGEYQIESEKYRYLNKKLRHIPEGAWFYWYHTIELLDE
jgi:hypothetical protein